MNLKANADVLRYKYSGFGPYIVEIISNGNVVNCLSFTEHKPRKTKPMLKSLIRFNGRVS